jgi:hypothetical protein
MTLKDAFYCAVFERGRASVVERRCRATTSKNCRHGSAIAFMRVAVVPRLQSIARRLQRRQFPYYVASDAAAEADVWNDVWHSVRHSVLDDWNDVRSVSHQVTPRSRLRLVSFVTPRSRLRLVGASRSSFVTPRSRLRLVSFVTPRRLGGQQPPQQQHRRRILL